MSEFLAALQSGQQQSEPRPEGPTAKGAVVTIPDTLEATLAAANKHMSRLLNQGATMPKAAHEEIGLFFELAGAIAERERDQVGLPAGGEPPMGGPPNSPTGPPPAGY